MLFLNNEIKANSILEPIAAIKTRFISGIRFVSCLKVKGKKNGLSSRCCNMSHRHKRGNEKEKGTK